MTRSVVGRTFARAGLLGNPSDGYHGKTISLIVGNFRADVELRQSDRIVFGGRSNTRSFESLDQFKDAIGPIEHSNPFRLVKAALKRFIDYCEGRWRLDRSNFSVEFTSSIPRQVGLAGSSAIVMSTLRALARWFDVTIEPDVLASLTLTVETDELGIPAGLQDRVIQAREGLVHMDFSKQRMRTVNGLQVGYYQPLDFEKLPPLYVAFGKSHSEPTEVTHNDLRARFNRGDDAVIEAMREFASIAEAGKHAIECGDPIALAQLINSNFELRRRICVLNPRHVAMVEVARSTGASAKFCGSGGAIVGTFDNPRMYMDLQSRLGAIDCEVVKPLIGHFQSDQK